MDDSPPFLTFPAPHTDFFFIHSTSVCFTMKCAWLETHQRRNATPNSLCASALPRESAPLRKPSPANSCPSSDMLRAV